MHFGISYLKTFQVYALPGTMRHELIVDELWIYDSGGMDDELGGWHINMNLRMELRGYRR